jgi:hypothetical protein
MHEVNLRVALGCTRGRMNVVTTEVATNVESFLNGKVCEVLVAECYDLLLGDEQGELVLPGICQFAELDTMDFSTDVRGDISDLGILQEIRKRWVGVLAVLGMLEGLPWWISAPMVSSRLE